jgi:3-oxoacyl-[acyl-carrier protein] reductase
MASALMIENKVALITGSTRGIGWSMAKLFAEHGAIVIINGHSNEELLRSRLSELKQISNKDHQAYQCDISSIDEVKECYNKIFKQFGKLDVLVNNAGIMQDSLIGTVTQDLISRIFAVNVTGSINNLQYASRIMTRKKSGSIINLSSIIGRVGNAGQVVYGSSKSAIIGLTYSASKELAPLNIRVNSIAPGFIDTEMTRAVPKAKYDSILASIKMGRIGQPEDIAKAALFFASDYSSYVTGQILGVDGGMLI